MTPMRSHSSTQPNAPADKHQKRVALLTGGAFHAFHDGIADGLATFFPLWQAAFNLTLTQVGLLVTCFEGATGLFQISAGLLGERFGERTLLIAGTLVTAISFILLGFAEGLVSLVGLLLIGGLGASVQHPLAASMVSKAYGGEGRRIALGTYNFSGDIGKFLFPVLAAAAFSQVGWRPVCMAFGLIGCLLTLAMALLFSHTRLLSGEPTAGYQKMSPEAKGWGIVNQGAFVTLSTIAIIDTAVRVGVITFGPFLFIEKGVRPESVGFALALLFIGGAAGKFICGVLAARLGIITTVVMTECMTGFGILLLALLPLPYIFFFLPLLGAVLNGTSSVLYGTVADFVHPDRVARAFGIFYTFVIASTAIATPVLGQMSDKVGVSDSMRLIGWMALSTLPLAALLAYQRSR